MSSSSNRSSRWQPPPLQPPRYTSQPSSNELNTNKAEPPIRSSTQAPSSRWTGGNSGSGVINNSRNTSQKQHYPPHTNDHGSNNNFHNRNRSKGDYNERGYARSRASSYNSGDHSGRVRGYDSYNNNNSNKNPANFRRNEYNNTNNDKNDYNYSDNNSGKHSFFENRNSYEQPKNNDSRRSRSHSSFDRYHDYDHRENSRDTRDKDRSRSSEYYGPCSSSDSPDHHDKDSSPRNFISDSNSRRGRKHSFGNEKKMRESTSNSSSKRAKKNPPRSPWPPPFESGGASYVFDHRSGLFYEAKSDFFFDPKNKLYYGNKQKAYFQYVAGADPEFRPITSTAHQNTADNNVNSSTLQDSNSDPSSTSNKRLEVNNQETQKPSSQNDPTTTGVAIKLVDGATKPTQAKNEKKKIAISITQKKFSKIASSSTNNSNSNSTPPKTNVSSSINSSSVVASSNNPSTTTTPKIDVKQKKHAHAADIHKWAERGREMRTDANNNNNNSEANTTTSKSKSSDTTSIDINENEFIRTTASGKPACLLCKRKFADMDKLKQHIELSALHKENLEKRKKEMLSKNERGGEGVVVVKKQDLPDSSSVEYRDRARERRCMYGPDASSAYNSNTQSQQTLGTTSGTKSNSNVEILPQQPQENLGENNIGNQMLKKLGWNPDAKENAACVSSDDTNNRLRSDWEKIEALAQSSQTRRR